MDRKILIIDDEAYIRLLLEQTFEDLEDEGVEIFTAANGSEGLEKARAEKPDLIFLDVMMPEINGFDVCLAIKREMTDAFVILLTAKGQDYDRQRGEEVGADLYMTKPFDPDELLDKAEEILGL